jgi:thiol-disulfide isomerase/thioredoxin
VIPEEILVFTQNSRGDENKLQLSFMFPEFRYSKFTYEGESFLICTDAYQVKPTITILPDEPRFTRVSEDQKIEINQFLEVGDMRFQFIDRSANGYQISLLPHKSVNVKTDRSENWGVDYEQNSSVISSQVGYKAPEVKGTDIVSKDNLSTEGLKGKYVYLDFWSTSCAPCIADFKHIREAYSKFDRTHFEIIGVVDERKPGSTEDLLIKHGVSWPNIKANTSGTVTTGYNILSYPTTYLLDPSGKIISKNVRGEELLQLLRTLIKK